MYYQNDHCLVCNTGCTSGVYDYEDKKEVNCERCGKFKISLYGYSSSEIKKYKNGNSILSYFIRNFSTTDDLLDRLKINSVLEQYKLPDYDEKFLNMLQWIAKQSEYSTKSVSGKSNQIASVVGAIDGNDLLEIMDDLWNERLILVEQPLCKSLRELGNIINFKVHLTPTGLSKSKQNNFMNKNNKIEDFDAFISHSSEDKESLVRPLAN